MKLLNKEWLLEHLVEGGKSALIADRLAWLVRLTMVAFAALGIVYLVSSALVAWEVNAQGKLGSYAMNVKEFDLQLLQMRRNEKDFFERRSQEELEKFGKSHEQAVAALQRARANPRIKDDEVAQIDAMLSGLEKYRQSFQKAADLQIALGLDENEGLQGKLRDAVHEVERIALSAGSTRIAAAMLMERRHEKDFMLRGREEYHRVFLKDMDSLRAAVGDANLSATQHQHLDKLIDTYERSFGNFVSGTFAMDKAVANARQIAHELEAQVPGLVKDAVVRGDAAAANSMIAVAVVALILVAALVGVTMLLRTSLGTVRQSLTDSVAALQHTVGRVRAGEQVETAEAASQDEMGQIWRSVNELLEDRMAAQKKAEAENDALNNSVIAILQGVDVLAHRDLTARVPVSQDIIGTVSDSVNSLADETVKVLRNVSEIAAQVSSVSENVRSQGEKVSLTAEDERKSVADIFNSLGNATSSINRVAALAEQSNDAATRATQVTNTALDTVNSTVRGMDSIRETISETEKRIKRLGERSQEISGIVNMINTIAERTHVLALNASMQAAVAGEAGRGFAVVAEEVQRLAESSRNATQQIATLVNNIQLETNETIATVNRTIGQVVQGLEQAQQAGEQMRQTQEITHELVEQVRRISEASMLQKEVSVELLDAVQKLGSNNQNTAQQIEAQFAETESLREAAKKLVLSISVFKLPEFA